MFVSEFVYIQSVSRQAELVTNTTAIACAGDMVRLDVVTDVSAVLRLEHADTALPEPSRALDQHTFYTI